MTGADNTNADNLPEHQLEANPPDDRANAPAWITFVLGGAILFVAGIGFVALFGVPGQGPGGTSPNQQQASGAPPPPANQRAASGGAGPRETTGAGAPTTPKQ